jgi:Uma2 family endonuclease
MAEPARKTRVHEIEKPADEALEEPDFPLVLQRWVERPDGSLDLLELPLTPELFLDPQLEDKMVQGRLHSDLLAYFKELVGRYLRPRRDVMVLMDVKHLLGPGLPGPSPDISVIRGARNPEADRSSFNVVKEGVVPCLIIEVVSPLNARIRRTDEVDKVKLYEQIGVHEYLLVNPPRKATGNRFRLTGYRLGSRRRYQAIEPDELGRLLSKTTGLRFGVAPQGDRIEAFDDATGERLRSPEEEVAAREAAESMVAREAEARKAAEAEVARLRAEIERLKGS